MTAQIKIVYKKTADLIPYARNSRTHDEGQIAQIAASIKEFGFTNPILIDGTNGIIAGHGRLMAAQKLGEEKVPTIELSHLTEGQKRAYIIADNKLALNAGWDMEVLKFEISELKPAELALTGFSVGELKSWFGDDEDENSDAKEMDLNVGYEIIVECDSEYEQRKLLEKLTEEGYKCKSMLR
jgi:ParB-like chromosome segregation protein Spo0J